MKGDNISRAALLRKAQTINVAGAKMRVVLVEDVEEAQAVDAKYTEDVSESHPSDEFICSECGICVCDFKRCVDLPEGEEYYEYHPEYCPECGLPVRRR